MAPKKAAKKAGKKLAKHHEKDRHAGKDLRRAYEHLGRLSAMEKHLAAGVVVQMKVLTDLAQASLLAGEKKIAAELLRAGEHLGFGTMASSAKAARLGEELEAAVRAEYEHLVEKAGDRWDKHEGERPGAIEDVYESMMEGAGGAFAKKAYRRALEFARGAEALSHVRGEKDARLQDGGAVKRLKG
jgi:hypothetical protein